jgi:hypothetical protein
LPDFNGDDALKPRQSRPKDLKPGNGIAPPKISNSEIKRITLNKLVDIVCKNNSGCDAIPTPEQKEDWHLQRDSFRNTTKSAEGSPNLGKVQRQRPEPQVPQQDCERNQNLHRPSKKNYLAPEDWLAGLCSTTNL